MSEDLTDKLPKTDSDKLNEILTRVNGIDSRLEQLEQTVAQRLHDTRPIWHKVVADIAQLQEGQQRLEKGQGYLHEQLLKINSGVRDVNRDQIVINDSLRRIQLDLHNFDERLHRCETNRRQNSST
jgi:hypothetical protein